MLASSSTPILKLQTILNKKLFTTASSITQPLHSNQQQIHNKIHPGYPSRKKQNSIINSSKVHRNILYAIEKIDDSKAIITQEKTRITSIKIFPTNKKHEISFPDQRICKITKIMYISFTLESEFNLYQIKYR